MARPKKYQDKRTMISLMIADTFIEQLDIESKNAGLSRTEYLNSLIASGNKNEAKRLAKSFSELKKAITNLKVTNVNLMNKLEKIGSGDIYDIVEPDELSLKAFKSIKIKYPNSKSKEFTEEKIFEEMQRLALLENKFIRNKLLAKFMIKKLMEA